MPARRELPDTIARSSAKAQRTWIKAHDAAVKAFGEGERAQRAAFAALKHSFEKVGDRWSPRKRMGPSGPQAARSGRAARRGGRTHGGVDALGSTFKELYERARKLGVRGRSRMRKEELARAIARKQR
jgi:hypothetical protein